MLPYLLTQVNENVAEVAAENHLNIASSLIIIFASIVLTMVDLQTVQRAPVCPMRLTQ